MNEKGQTLVIFVILIPILCLLATFVIDTSLMLYEKSRLDNINQEITTYSVNHLTEMSEEKVKEAFLKNDANLKEVKVKLTNTDIEVTVSKDVKSIFGNLIGIQSYKIKSSITKQVEKE